MNRIAFPITELTNSVKSNTDTYLISICIPTYNRIINLEKCLNILFEKYGNSVDVEIVVIDNGSSDGTSDYLINNSNYFSNTSFYTREFNAGFDINVLDCFFKAKGKYVHFLGDDDIVVVGAFDELINIIRRDSPDLVISDYIIETSTKTYNAVNKQTIAFDNVDSLFSYVGHHITFMSSITLIKQPVSVCSMCKYFNLKFMHIGLILELLSGKNSKLLFLNMPIAIATDHNPATYDVSYLFLNDLIRLFQLNAQKLDYKKLELFFISVMCYCLRDNVKISAFFFNNAIIGLIGFWPILNFKIFISLLRGALGRLKRALQPISVNGQTQ